MGLYQKVTGTAPLLAALKGRFRLFIFFFLLLTKTPRFHLFTFSPFHLFTFSPFHVFTKTPRFHIFTFSHFHDFGIDENTTISLFHDFTISILTKTPRFHDFTFSRFHDFTSSISRYDAIALYLAPDGNHLTAVAVTTRAARLFSLLPWNLDNLARCALQTLTLQCPVIGIGVGAGGYIDRITPGHCRRGREDKEE